MTLTKKRIYPVGKTNPRKPGTFGHDSHAIILKHRGKTFEKLKALGVRREDVLWDIKHGWVRAA